ncbi:hypothetical protein L484_002764 [Morus notabilis]|uniref:Uncharacterized protein n=1 Tax=Morus notabilis TaxID=981085 RepID=W9RN21_9ROSA|nr:hypothetical protein L484_002764 [Morus notabilis]
MLDLAIYVASAPCCGVVVTGGISRRVWTRADPIIASQGHRGTCRSVSFGCFPPLHDGPTTKISPTSSSRRCMVSDRHCKARAPQWRELVSSSTPMEVATVAMESDLP